MYSAIFCVAISNALLSANWLIAVTSVVSVSLMYFARVADEERMLIEQFGDEYRAYMQRTGRLFPRLRHPPATHEARMTAAMAFWK